MENCPYHTDHNTRINHLEKSVENLDNRITDCEKSSAVMTERIANALDNLSRLPEAIDRLKETNIKLENKIDNVNNKVNGLTKDFEGIKSEIKIIDNDGKINIRRGFRDWFVKHWVEIVIVLALASYIAKDFISSLVK